MKSHDIYRSTGMLIMSKISQIQEKSQKKYIQWNKAPLVILESVEHITLSYTHRSKIKARLESKPGKLEAGT